MFKRKKFRPNRAHLGTVHGSCSPCSSVSQPRPLPGYLVVRNQASGTIPLKEVLRLSALLFPAFFQGGNMGIICFDQYFHILNTTVIEKPLGHQACTRMLQHIVKRRGESLCREISKWKSRSRRKLICRPNVLLRGSKRLISSAYFSDSLISFTLKKKKQNFPDFLLVLEFGITLPQHCEIKYCLNLKWITSLKSTSSWRASPLPRFFW